MKRRHLAQIREASARYDPFKLAVALTAANRRVGPKARVYGRLGDVSVTEGAHRSESLVVMMPQLGHMSTNAVALS